MQDDIQPAAAAQPIIYTGDDEMPVPKPGQVVHHCSEDDGLADVGIAIGLPGGHQLWLGELLKRDGGDIGFILHGPQGERTAAPLNEWGDVRDLFAEKVAPLFARTAVMPSTADDVRTMIRAWLDADDATHWGAFEKKLDALVNEGGAPPSIEQLGAAAAGNGETLRFLYKNYRGEIGLREVAVPIVARFGSTEWHPEPQWLVHAIDVEKGLPREFALRDMRFLHQLYDGDDR